MKWSQIHTEARGGINETAIAIPTILSSNLSDHKKINAITPDNNATTKSITVGLHLKSTCSVIDANGTR
jgi:hypothetical protein